MHTVCKRSLCNNSSPGKKLSFVADVPLFFIDRINQLSLTDPETVQFTKEKAVNSPVLC